VVDAALVAGVTVASALIGGVQRRGTDRALSALLTESAVTARVRRDGQEVTLPGDQLVAGDVVLLGRADVVPADCRVFERPKHSRTYSLTTAGDVIAKELMDAHSRLQDVVRNSVTKHQEAWLPVTNNCLEVFTELRQALPPTITLWPSPRRSADLAPVSLPVASDRAAATSRPMALYSACLPSLVKVRDSDESKRLREHEMFEIAEADGTTMLLVLDPQPFKILGLTEMFGTRESARIDDVWNRHGRLIVPDGGAVRDFLDRAVPSWERRRPFVRATDLESCLICLDLVPRSAMIVHGFDDKEPPRGYRLYNIDGSADYVAAVGLFHRTDLTGALPEREQAMWQTIWSAAKGLWLKPATKVSAA